MLAHLTIENLALVERVGIELGPGLNVLTGETGAGKSVLMGALSLVLGDRVSVDMIRHGEDEAVVEALFELSRSDPILGRLEANGLEPGDGQLVVRRVLRRSGRGRAWVNGRLVSARQLSELTSGLVELTGQHAHVRLLDPATHLEVLDAFVDAESLRAKVQVAADAHRVAKEALLQLEQTAAEVAVRQDYLRHAVDEIDELAPEPGELERVSEELRRLQSVGELTVGLARAEHTLYSSEGAVAGAVGRVARDLRRLTVLDPALEPYGEASERIAAEVEELARCLGRRQHSLETSPDRERELEARLDQLHRMIRKHGANIESVLVARERMARELEVVDDLDHHRARCGAAAEAAAGVLSAACAKLSLRRQAGRRRLEAEVHQYLEELALSDMRFELALRSVEPGPRGAEMAELQLAPNVGEASRALRKTASGGELSRVLLALKCALAGADGARVQMFDEVDTGLGGEVAHAVGRQLARLGRGRQVVVVTHLPPVAACADHHLLVRKRVIKGRTCTEVQCLDEPSKLAELARMLGAEVSPGTLSFVEDLRRRAREDSQDSAVVPFRAAKGRRVRSRNRGAVAEAGA